MKNRDRLITGWTCVVLALTLLAWSVGFGLLAAVIKIPVILTGIISFIVVVGFMSSPYWNRYADWLADRVAERVK
jgi:uncharacterized membrane protein